MPNHCENDLRITGPADILDKFLNDIGANSPEGSWKFNFNVAIPYPEDWAKLDAEFEALGWDGFCKKYGKDAKDGFNSGGYDWCISNWGTKWNAYEVTWEEDEYDQCATVHFSTAWSPPIPVIIALAKKYPELTFTFQYFECGVGFAGGFVCPSKEDSDDPDHWEAGIIEHQWETTEYRGSRGG